VLGRLASEVANILRGKNKPIYTPNKLKPLDNKA
ncbi:MAG: uL13 family ribosomal protein, partial [Treponema sp.]|nr:uL13 family ribosomal protein [Treponema sp.]